MGSNDAAEMLEVAKEECRRLERDLAGERRGRQRDYDWMMRKLGEVVDARDMAIAQRDASRQVNAEFLAARSAEVLVEGSFFRADEFPAILGNYMRLNDVNSAAMKAGYLHTERMRGQRDAAYAAIERVLNLTGDFGPEARRILTQVPTDALADHREVWDAGYAKALTDDGYDLKDSGYSDRVNPYRKAGE
jgi:hypothetical protein